LPTGAIGRFVGRARVCGRFSFRDHTQDRSGWLPLRRRSSRTGGAPFWRNRL